MYRYESMTGMKYPKGTRFNRWTLNLELQKGSEVLVIRRWVTLPDKTKKHDRLPVQKYKHLRSNRTELELFVIRLNKEYDDKARVTAAVEIKHAFISPILLEEYKELLLVRIPTRGRALLKYHYTIEYFLKFFIVKLDLVNPVDWHQVHKVEWAKYLVGPNTPKSAATKKEIVQAANAFMQWLNEKRPLEVPFLKFDPISPAKYKMIEAERRLKGDVKERRYITDSEWQKIQNHLPDYLVPFANMGYYYGLRRAETLSLELDDVKKGHLLIQRQLESIGSVSPLKGRLNRKVPHWFVTPNKAYEWIKSSKAHQVHPDTLTEYWNDYMKSINMDFDFHELRHTYITNALRIHKKNLLEVRDAAGHVNVKTTEQYLRDLPTEDDENFLPKAS